jgi:hypothetical protein
MKRCQRCQRWQRLSEFPLDRSRRDGHWHTCRLCNRKRGRLLRRDARERKKRELLTAPPPIPTFPRPRLSGLKKYRNKSGEAFANLSPVERLIALQLFNKYMQQRQGVQVLQPQRALLMACAASNAKRVRDSRWGRRMRWLKGQCRRQRELEQQMQLAEIPDRNAAPARASTRVGYTTASRLAGI